MSRRRQAWLLGAAAGVLAAAAGIAGAVLCESAVRPHPRKQTVRGESWRQASLVSFDGVRLSGWFSSPARPNGACVLLLHGIADSHASAAGGAALYLEEGYAVLVTDSRAHGASGGELVTYGVLEKRDAQLWAGWLRNRAGCRSVFGSGASMGGAVLLQAATGNSPFDAIAAECPFSSLETIARYRIAQQLPLPLRVGEWLAWPAVSAGTTYGRWRYGFDLRQASPERLARKIGIPVLLIHGSADSNTPPSHSISIASANPRFELWLVAGAGHTGAAAAAPEQYRRRMTGFFERYRR